MNTRMRIYSYFILAFITVMDFKFTLLDHDYVFGMIASLDGMMLCIFILSINYILNEKRDTDSK